MDYEIIATLGPSSEQESTWREMISAGVTGFRLNTSHLSIVQLRAWLERLIPFFSILDQLPPVVLDLQGSKWRLGDFPTFELRPGYQVELVYTAATTRPQTLPVPHRDFFSAASSSNGVILLNDAKARLALESVNSEVLLARVITGGEITPRKGITFASCEYRKESLSEKDELILAETGGLPFLRYALSYVKDMLEMKRYRLQFGTSAYLIAKLERPGAVEGADQMARLANELWLCRGDLGAELGMRDMADVVHRFSKRINEISIPILLAGQILEHMTGHATPTRSEVCYLYDALRQGYRGVVLSDESAIGRYPLESCQAAAMFKISSEKDMQGDTHNERT
jgi:pyruvate kinase